MAMARFQRASAGTNLHDLCVGRFSLWQKSGEGGVKLTFGSRSLGTGRDGSAGPSEWEIRTLGWRRCKGYYPMTHRRRAD